MTQAAEIIKTIIKTLPEPRQDAIIELVKNNSINLDTLGKGCTKEHLTNLLKSDEPSDLLVAAKSHEALGHFAKPSKAGMFAPTMRDSAATSPKVVDPSNGSSSAPAA